MTEPSKTVATGYGEADIEAKAMDGAASGKAKPDAGSPAPPPDTLVPAAGTTESDIGKNLRVKADRESKS